MDSGERGSGRTTRQLQSAPIGAVFIVPNRNCCSYTEALARHLGRADLKIVSVDLIERPATIHGGRRKLVVDHAAWDFMRPSQKAVAREFLKMQEREHG